jgi:hypothetical protein
MLENAVDTTFLTGIHDPAHGFGHRTIMDVFEYLFTTYGNIGPADVIADLQKMTTPIDPTRPIAHLFKQIEDSQKYAAAAQAPITPMQIIKAAETLILQTGKYQTAYREYTNLPAAERTYLNFKTRMTAEYWFQNQVTTTTRAVGYHHANAAISAPGSDEEHLAAAASDFASAQSANRTAFANLLTSSNGELNHQMANMVMQNHQLQDQVGQMQQNLMYLAAAPPAPAYPPQPRVGQNRNRHQGRSHRPPVQSSWQGAGQEFPAQYRPPIPQAPATYQPPAQQYRPPPTQQPYQAPSPYQQPPEQYG